MGDRNPKQKHRQDAQKNAAKNAKAAKVKAHTPATREPEKTEKT